MNPSQKEHIRSNLTSLVEATPHPLTPLTHFLIERKVLTEVEVESINGQPTRPDRAYELYTTVMRKGPHAFEILIEGLEQAQALEAAGILRKYRDRAGQEMETDSRGNFSNQNYQLK